MQAVDAQTVREILDKDNGWLLLDVLPEDHFEQRHIPGAENVPAKSPDFVSRVQDLAKSKDSRIIVYCASTSCDLSPAAARELERSGFTNVMDFEGGIEEWNQEGYKLVSNGA